MMLPLSDDNMRYNINTKIPGFKVKEGKLSKGGKLIFECTEQKPCVGLNDQGRHIVPYAEGGWFWASMSAVVDGLRIALNTGYSKGDRSDSTDDSIYLDGKLFKLDPTVVEKVDNTTWKFTSFRGDKNMVKFEKNSVDLTFKIDDVSTLTLDSYHERKLCIHQTQLQIKLWQGFWHFKLWWQRGEG